MRGTTQDDSDTPSTPNPDTKSLATTKTQEENEPQTLSQTLATSLITRCRTLLTELDTFKALLGQTQRNPQTVEVRSLRSNVLSELRALEKLSFQLDEVIATSTTASATAAANTGTETQYEAIPTDAESEAAEVEQRVLHALRSSNLPFYEAVWTTAKRTCTGLVALGKRFYWNGSLSRDDSGSAGRKKPNKDKQKSVFVDIVADDGEEWVKVSTISETRLLFEMAKKGWEGDSEDEELDGRTVLQNHLCGEDGDEYEEEEDDDDDEIELLKLAEDMRKAASLVRVNYKRPRLRFVIPKIEAGRSSDIDDLLRVIRGHGVVVHCGDNVSTSQLNTRSAEEEVRQLLPNRFKRFTSTLNVDCTLLLAIISDLSHYKNIAQSPKHHKAINRQIEIESERPLLSTELWPAMDSHHLICTSEAAKRMREIVETIGTETERKRMAILMADDPFNDANSASLVEKLQELSDYELPAQLHLPIRTVEVKHIIKSAKEHEELPPVADKVEGILSDINTSVFMYGWVSGIMTITSNRTVVKQIEAMVEMHRDNENLEGPLIWVCDTARSLIGKEKGRKS